MEEGEEKRGAEGMGSGKSGWREEGMEELHHLSGTHLGSTAHLISCDRLHLMKRDHGTPVVCKE